MRPPRHEAFIFLHIVLHGPRLCRAFDAGRLCERQKTHPKAEAEKPQEPVETLYNAAANELEAGNFYKAAKAFDEVDRQYPYSEWATRAQMMPGYAH